MRFTISSFITLAVAVGTVAAEIAERSSLNPPLSLVRDVDFASLPPAIKPATNAERLAQGLPPMSPRSRKHRRAVADDAIPRRATPVSSALRAGTSPSVPMRKSCNILVRETDGSSRRYGYLSPKFNSFGQYGTFQPNQDGALVVSFSYSADSLSQLDLNAVNGPSPAYPYLGGAVESGPSGKDLGPKSRNYASIAGVRQTPAGSPAVSGSSSYGSATGFATENESAIWVYNPETDAITAQWVNSDGSSVAAYFLYANDGNDAILLTGSPGDVRERFNSDYPQLSFTCATPKTN